MRRGFQRVKVDGEFYELEDVPALDKKKKHEIEVVVDRLVTAPDLAQRLADSIETAIGLSNGLLIAENADDGERTTLSAKFACPVCGFTLPEIETTPVFLQQPLRRLPLLRWPWQALADRSQPGRSRYRQIGLRWCRRTLVIHHHELLPAGTRWRLQVLEGLNPRPLAPTAEKGAGNHPLRFGQQKRADGI